MSDKPFHEKVGLPLDVCLDRLIWLAQISHQHKTEYGKPLNLKHLEAVLKANKK